MLKSRLIGSGGGSSFTPASMASIKLWLDPADGATITLGTGISQINDKSGLGNNATQATGSAQPTQLVSAKNGKNAMLFTAASSQFFTLTSGINIQSGYALIFVTRRSAAGVNNVNVFGTSVDSAYAAQWFGDNAIYAGGTNGNANGVVSTAQALSGNWYLVEVVVPGGVGASKVYLNGSNVTSSSQASAGTGAAMNWIGRLAGTFYNNDALGDVIVTTNASYDASSDQTNLRAYLNSKWALP